LPDDIFSYRFGGSCNGWCWYIYFMVIR
jgi:hypothetical protein